MQPELRVVAPLPPAVLVLGPGIREQQDACYGEPLDEGIENALGLGIDPVQILEDHAEGPRPALREQELCHRLRRSAALLR
jgi:hypothetical protein